MPDPNFKEKHFRAAKAILGDIGSLQNGNISTPFQSARIITENGQIWETEIGAFGASKEIVLMLWDSQPSKFRKIELARENS